MASQRKNAVVKWRDSKGTFRLTIYPPRVVVVELVGLAAQPSAAVIEKELDAAFSAGNALQVFWELGELVNYHSDVRVCSTRVLLCHRERFEALHAYCTSKIVAMGVSVANLALGGIAHVHKERASFDRALDAAILAVGWPPE